MLLAKKITVLVKYINFANIFLKKLAKVLPKQISINEHIIKIIKNEQLSYRVTYSLESVKLKIFKIYIKIKRGNGFIRHSNSLASAFI